MDTKAGKAGLRIKDSESTMNVMEGCSVQECDFVGETISQLHEFELCMSLVIIFCTAISSTDHQAQYFQQ